MSGILPLLLSRFFGNLLSAAENTVGINNDEVLVAARGGAFVYGSFWCTHNRLQAQKYRFWRFRKGDAMVLRAAKCVKKDVVKMGKQKESDK